MRVVLFHHEEVRVTKGVMFHFSLVVFIGLLNVTDMFADREMFVSTSNGDVLMISGGTSKPPTFGGSMKNENKNNPETASALRVRFAFMEVTHSANEDCD